jgi:uncharacterized protein YjbI with pentapeptide repeats
MANESDNLGSLLPAVNTVLPPIRNMEQLLDASVLYDADEPENDITLNREKFFKQLRMLCDAFKAELGGILSTEELKSLDNLYDNIHDPKTDPTVIKGRGEIKASLEKILLLFRADKENFCKIQCIKSLLTKISACLPGVAGHCTDHYLELISDYSIPGLIARYKREKLEYVARRHIEDYDGGEGVEVHVKIHLAMCLFEKGIYIYHGKLEDIYANAETTGITPKRAAILTKQIGDELELDKLVDWLYLELYAYLNLALRIHTDETSGKLDMIKLLKSAEIILKPMGIDFHDIVMGDDYMSEIFGFNFGVIKGLLLHILTETGFAAHPNKVEVEATQFRVVVYEGDYQAAFYVKDNQYQLLTAFIASQDKEQLREFKKTYDYEAHRAPLFSRHRPSDAELAWLSSDLIGMRLLTDIDTSALSLKAIMAFEQTHQTVLADEVLRRAMIDLIKDKKIGPVDPKPKTPIELNEIDFLYCIESGITDFAYIDLTNIRLSCLLKNMNRVSLADAKLKPVVREILGNVNVVRSSTVSTDMLYRFGKTDPEDYPELDQTGFGLLYERGFRNFNGFDLKTIPWLTLAKTGKLEIKQAGLTVEVMNLLLCLYQGNLPDEKHYPVDISKKLILSDEAFDFLANIGLTNFSQFDLTQVSIRALIKYPESISPMRNLGHEQLVLFNYCVKHRSPDDFFSLTPDAFALCLEQEQYPMDQFDLGQLPIDTLLVAYQTKPGFSCAGATLLPAQIGALCEQLPQDASDVLFALKLIHGRPLSGKLMTEYCDVGVHTFHDCTLVWDEAMQKLLTSDKKCNIAPLRFSGAFDRAQLSGFIHYADKAEAVALELDITKPVKLSGDLCALTDDEKVFIKKLLLPVTLDEDVVLDEDAFRFFAETCNISDFGRCYLSDFEVSNILYDPALQKLGLNLRRMRFKQTKIDQKTFDRFNTFPAPDWQNADLSGLTLRLKPKQYAFAGARLVGAQIIREQGRRYNDFSCDFSHCNLTGASFRVDKTIFTFTDDTSFHWAIFNNAILENATFDCCFCDCSFDHANLKNATMNHEFCNCSFMGADLRNIILGRAAHYPTYYDEAAFHLLTNLRDLSNRLDDALVDSALMLTIQKKNPFNRPNVTLSPESLPDDLKQYRNFNLSEGEYPNLSFDQFDFRKIKISDKAVFINPTLSHCEMSADAVMACLRGKEGFDFSSCTISETELKKLKKNLFLKNIKYIKVDWGNVARELGTIQDNPMSGCCFTVDMIKSIPLSPERHSTNVINGPVFERAMAAGHRNFNHFTLEQVDFRAESLCDATFQGAIVIGGNFDLKSLEYLTRQDFKISFQSVFLDNALYYNLLAKRSPCTKDFMTRSGALDVRGEILESCDFRGLKLRFIFNDESRFPGCHFDDGNITLHLKLHLEKTQAMAKITHSAIEKLIRNDAINSLNYFDLTGQNLNNITFISIVTTPESNPTSQFTVEGSLVDNDTTVEGATLSYDMACLFLDMNPRFQFKADLNIADFQKLLDRGYSPQQCVVLGSNRSIVYMPRTVYPLRLEGPTDLSSITLDGYARFPNGIPKGSQLSASFYYMAHMHLQATKRIGAILARDTIMDCLDVGLNDFCDANLKGLDLKDCDLKKADFSGADLSDADLTLANLTRVRSNDKTSWPKAWQPYINYFKYCDNNKTPQQVLIEILKDLANVRSSFLSPTKKYPELSNMLSKKGIDKFALTELFEDIELMGMLAIKPELLTPFKLVALWCQDDALNEKIDKFIAKPTDADSPRK